MKQIISFVLAAIGAFSTGMAHAQLAEPSSISREQQLVEKVGLERLPTTIVLSIPGDARNISALLQTGTGNASTVEQRSLSLQENQAYIVQAGAANILGLTQTGGGNQAYMTQLGIGNHANFSQNGQGNSSTIVQKGDYNILDGTVDGRSNKVDIYQNGSNNQVKTDINDNNRNLTISQSNGKFTISQEGNGNTLTQLETSPQSKGYGVEMRGNGINLTIEQGKVR